MKIASVVVRLLMGAMFLLASVTYFLHLVPEQQLSGDVQLFHDGIMASKYLFPTVKVFELVCAIAFLVGRFVPLATIIIFPITLNILLYHAFVDPGELVVAVPLMIGNLFLAYYYRKSYLPLMVSK